MKPKFKTLHHHLGVIIVRFSGLALLGISSTHAASDIWDGTNSGSWADSSNWLTDLTIPGTGNIATFNNAGNGNTTIDLGGGVTIGSLLFDTSGVAAYTIGSGAVGSQTLSFDNAGGITLNSGVTNNQLINANINLSSAANAATTLTNNSTATLTIAGGIAANVASGNGVLTVAGSGNITVAGTITKPGAGSNALLKTGSGTLTLSNGSTWSGSGAIGRIPATTAGFPLVAREGTLLLNGGAHTVTGEAVIGGVVADGGAGQNAKIQVDAGSLTVSSWLSVGRGNGVGAVSSDLVLNNAATVSAGNLSAGFNGGSGLNLPKGSITLNNTSSLTITGNGAFNFAESAGSNMTMTLNNASQLIATGTGVKYIGQGGTGVMNINGTSSVSFGNQLTYIGYQSGTGTLNLNGGTFSNTGEVRVGGSITNGTGPNGTGTFNISSGTATVGALVAARGNNNQNTVSGSVTVSGGTLNTVNDVVLGYAGNNNLGKLTVSGGIVNVGTGGAKWLQVGVWDTSKGQIDISSGSLNLLNGTQIKMNSQGTIGANVINQTGGSVTFYSDGGTTVGGAGHLDMQRVGSAASSNTYNLNGGTLTVPQILSSATTGTRTFNFNGGTLKAAGNNTAFLNLGAGSARANVRDNGAIIHSNGYDVTIAQALLQSNVSGDLGTGGLTKQGVGALTLSGVNTYTGATSVDGGSLLISGTGSLASSAVTVASVAALGGSGTISGSVSSAGQLLPGGPSTIGTLTVGNGLSLSGGNIALDFNGSNNATGGGVNDLLAITGNISVTGVVIVSPSFSSTPVASTSYTFGTYTGTLSGGENFAAGSRAITIDTATANQLKLTYTGAASGNLNWSSTSSSAWDVVNTLNWYNSGTSATDRFYQNDTVTFDNTAGLQTNVVLSTSILPGSVVVNSDSSGNNYNFSGIGGISGASSLTKSGTSTLTIDTANTYTGATSINGGTLQLNGSLSGTAISVASGATLSESATGAIGGSSSLSVAGTATLVGTNTYTGGTTVNGGGSVSISSAANLGAASSSLTLDNGTLTLTNNSALTINRVISVGSNGGTLSIVGTATTGQGSRVIHGTANGLTGSGNLTISGNGSLSSAGGQGVLVVTGSNSFSGNINLVDGGTFEYDNASAVASAATFTLGDNSEITTANGRNVVNAITVNGTGAVISFTNNGNGVYSGPITLNADANIALRNWWNYGGAQNGTISGVISGSGGIATNRGTSTGTPSLTLTGVNTYGGATSIATGTSLIVGSAGQLGAGSYAGAIANGGTLNQNSSADQIYSGVISGAGAFSQTGAGTTTLSGANTYTGTTTVTAGKMLVNGNVSTSVLTTISGTGTLGGSGTVGTLVVATGATLAPGNSPGILNSGDVDLQSGSTFAVEINGLSAGSEYDQLNVTGTVTLAGLLNISLGFTPVENDLFFVLLNDGADSINGTFSELADGSELSASGQTFKISYFGDSATNSFTGGNDVVLMAVPEPGAALLGGLGMLALLRRRRS